MKALRLHQSLPVLLVLGALAQAQSVTTLRADRHELGVAESLELRFDRELAGAVERVPWPEEFDWLLVRASGTQRNFDALPLEDAEARELSLPLFESGVTLIAADRKPRIEEVRPRQLRVFLRNRVGPAVLPALPPAADRETLRVRHLESSKLLVRVLGSEGWLPNSATAQSKTGQRVEIRPLGDPTSVRLRTDMPLRVYVPNPEKQGTRVTARHLESGRRQRFETDREGTGYFTVDRPGVWIVAAHHATRLVDDPEADWEIHTATLTFEVPSWDPRETDGEGDR